MYILDARTSWELYKRRTVLIVLLTTFTNLIFKRLLGRKNEQHKRDSATKIDSINKMSCVPHNNLSTSSYSCSLLINSHGSSVIKKYRSFANSKLANEPILSDSNRKVCCRPTHPVKFPRILLHFGLLFYSFWETRLIWQ